MEAYHAAASAAGGGLHSSQKTAAPEMPVAVHAPTATRPCSPC